MLPSYLTSLTLDELKSRAQLAEKFLTSCNVCPRNCSVNRFNSYKGFCHSSYLPIVASYAPHFGEEPLISGTRGAGNIFFGNCNLNCVFCQNHQISQNWKSEQQNEVTFLRLADIMIELQNRGCHNIGFVSPTHFVPQILRSLSIAVEKGLKIPLIYNSNGYDSVEILKLLDGIIDIYLPDFKYGLDENAKEFSKADNYFEIASNAISEMFRQTGDKLIISDGVLLRGLVIRHLVLPNGLAESEKIFEFISNRLSPEVYISLMSQYYPAHKAFNYILLSRRIRESEYDKVLSLMEKYNLRNGWIQDLESYDYYRPDFIENRKNPFQDSRVNNN